LRQLTAWGGPMRRRSDSGARGRRRNWLGTRVSGSDHLGVAESQSQLERLKIKWKEFVISVSINLIYEQINDTPSCHFMLLFIFRNWKSKLSRIRCLRTLRKDVGATATHDPAIPRARFLARRNRRRLRGVAGCTEICWGSSPMNSRKGVKLVWGLPCRWQMRVWGTG